MSAPTAIRRTKRGRDAPALHRLGALVARNPVRVIAIWFVLLVCAVFSAGHFTSQLTARSNIVDGSASKRAADLVREKFPEAPGETDFVVLHSGTLTAQDAAFRNLVASVTSRYRATTGVNAVTSPYDEAKSLISTDRHTALVAVGLRGDQKSIQQAAPALQDLAGTLTTNQITVRFTGYSPLNAVTITQGDKDLSKAEAIGLPIAALVLLVAFGSVVAAVIPLAIGVVAVLSTFGVLGIVILVMGFDTIVQTAVSMVGIALGIDYSLFIATRFREELAKTPNPTREERAAAVGRTLSTAGQAVLFSGTTVMVSLTGLLVVRTPGVRAMAIGMSAAVLTMMVVSVTLLPAILGLLGTKINSLALPWARGSLAHPDPEHSGWARLTAMVMRRPASVAAVAAIALGLLAVPAVGLRYGVDLGTASASDSPAGEGFATVAENFAPGIIAPITVVATRGTGPLSDRQLDAISRFTRTAANDGRVADVSSVTTVLDQAVNSHTAGDLTRVANRSGRSIAGFVSSGGDTTVVTVFPRRAADATDTEALVRDLRADARTTLGGATLDAYVGGNPGQIVDITAENTRATPRVIAIVLAASWVLLLFAFRSLVLPFKAILMNLFTVGAAFGLVVGVFQDGHGAGLIGAHRLGFIQVLLPLLAFALVFGLSMDYEVFMLSRMREEWDATGDNRQAVQLGITRTARIITAAAAIMVVVFASFMSTRSMEIKQLGFMLAAAVLIDATVVRLLLVPALMRLMGSWNWWLPRWLDRVLPRVFARGH